MSEVTNEFQAKKTTPKSGKEGKYTLSLFTNKYLRYPILMAPEIFFQFPDLRVSASVRTVLLPQPSRFFRNHIFYAVLSGTLPFPGCYLIPMLQLSDSIFHSLHTLKHNIKGINGEEHHLNNQGHSLFSNITTRISKSKRRIWKLIFIMSIDAIGGSDFSGKRFFTIAGKETGPTQ